MHHPGLLIKNLHDHQIKLQILENGRFHTVAKKQLSKAQYTSHLFFFPKSQGIFSLHENIIPIDYQYISLKIKITKCCFCITEHFYL